MSGRWLALCGGTGGVKLADGLYRCLEPGRLTVACNVGDDFIHLGLAISPDLDTVCYTLAGLADSERGWGRADESWTVLGEVEALGGESWFKLGDKDIGLHLVRAGALATGATLSKATGPIVERLGVSATICPVTDAPLRTIVQSEVGALSFQDYFVRHRCEPAVTGFEFAGAEGADCSPPLAGALEDDELAGIVFCPSNPYLSIAPMLAVAPLRAALAARRVPAIGVSPMIGNDAIKGPTAKILGELGHEISAVSAARMLEGLVDGFVIDNQDRTLRGAIESLGMRVFETDILMRDPADRSRLAGEVVAMAGELSA